MCFANYALEEDCMDSLTLPELDQYELSYNFNEQMIEVPNDPDSMVSCIEALDAYLDAQSALSENDRDTENIVAGLGQLGTLLRMMGDLEESKQCLEIAISMVSEQDLNPLYATPQWIRLAETLRLMGDQETAGQILKNIIEDCHPVPALRAMEAQALHTMGRLYFDGGMYKEALNFFDKCSALRKSQNNEENGSNEAAIELTMRAMSQAHKI